MIVLSVFDGMSCGQIALKELGVPVKKYYASEIDKFAIEQTQHNFPDTIQLGDVTKVKAKDLPKIDLFIGGSPCQGFSFAGKQLNFDDPRSALFFEFVRIWEEVKEINPNAKFLLENVNMKKEYLRVISEYMGVFPVRINSNLVSAQNRDRWYWTNIQTKEVGLFGEVYSDIPQPEDKGVLLKDILEEDVPSKYFLSGKMINYFKNRAANFNNGKVNIRARNNKATTITASSSSVDISDNFVLDTTLKVKANQEKSNCFTAGGNSGGLHSDMDIVCVAMRGRNPENPSDRRTGSPTEQRLEPNMSGKTNCLSTVQKDNLVMQLKQINNRVDGVSFNEEGLRPYRNDAKKSGIQELGTIGMENTKSSCVTSVHSPKILIPEATTKGYAEIYPGDCVDLEHPNSQTRRGRKMGAKSNCLMAAQNSFTHYTKDFKLRRLTPTECARLQTIPPWYEWVVSDTQIYKMLGNGWTVEVIKHIFSFMTPKPK